MKRKEWNVCGKKMRYRDEHSANQYKRKCERERGIALDYYWCPYCKGFHLTSTKFRPEALGQEFAREYARYA